MDLFPNVQMEVTEGESRAFIYTILGSMSERRSLVQCYIRFFRSVILVNEATSYSRIMNVTSAR